MPFMDHEAFSDEVLTLIYSSYKSIYTFDKFPLKREYRGWWRI